VNFSDSAYYSPKKKAQIRCESGLFLIGAGEMNRTPDLLITNELLYRLSYTGVCWLAEPKSACKSSKQGRL
jgi:hypothetical protein